MLTFLPLSPLLCGYLLLILSSSAHLSPALRSFPQTPPRAESEVPHSTFPWYSPEVYCQTRCPEWLVPPRPARLRAPEGQKCCHSHLGFPTPNQDWMLSGKQGKLECHREETEVSQEKINLSLCWVFTRMTHPQALVSGRTFPRQSALITFLCHQGKCKAPGETHLMNLFNGLFPNGESWLAGIQNKLCDEHN